MADGDKSNDNAQVMHSLGQLTGAVQAMHQGLTARIEDIRADVRRMEAASADRMDRIENTLGNRIDRLETSVTENIDKLGNRVTALEVEDKRIIEKVAKLSAVGGGVGGALAAAAVELIKRM